MKIIAQIDSVESVGFGTSKDPCETVVSPEERERERERERPFRKKERKADNLL